MNPNINNSLNIVILYIGSTLVYLPVVRVLLDYHVIPAFPVVPVVPRVPLAHVVLVVP